MLDNFRTYEKICGGNGNEVIQRVLRILWTQDMISQEVLNEMGTKRKLTIRQIVVITWAHDKEISTLKKETREERTLNPV